MTPAVVLPYLETNLFHSTEDRSVEGELIDRDLHTYPLLQDNSAQAYHDLETDLQGISYLASIKPFKRAKNGRDAFFLVRKQYAGKEKWQA